ncbi:hypothetical protein ACFQT0_29550 [Hymenobacter humi]|uniref:DUF4402 domain-containing protein n=1 Tax=Hymenobacter humi TaxID=1411620 RepID=A0ABW2UDV2_9BACT
MKALLLIMPFAACLLGNCSKEVVLEGPRAVQAAAGFSPLSRAVVISHAVPFKGVFETTSVSLSGPPRQEQRITGTGQASHVGKATFEAYSTVVLTQTPPYALSGTSTMTAANGDQLFSTFTGTSMPQADGKLLVTIRHIISGGTGRFDRASGYYVGVTLADRASPNATLHLEGEIAY